MSCLVLSASYHGCTSRVSQSIRFRENLSWFSKTPVLIRNKLCLFLSVPALNANSIGLHRWPGHSQVETHIWGKQSQLFISIISVALANDFEAILTYVEHGRQKTKVGSHDCHPLNIIVDSLIATGIPGPCSCIFLLPLIVAHRWTHLSALPTWSSIALAGQQWSREGGTQ